LTVPVAIEPFSLRPLRWSRRDSGAEQKVADVTAKTT
jgi:hypothetical protein